MAVENERPREHDAITSTLKNQARGRSVDEQAPFVVCDPSFGKANPAAAIQDNAFGLDQTRLWRDGPYERHLEFKGRLTDALLKRGLDGQSHTAIEHRRGEAAMHGASGV